MITVMIPAENKIQTKPDKIQIIQFKKVLIFTARELSINLV